jgi:hypothetical protein
MMMMMMMMIRTRTFLYLFVRFLLKDPSVTYYIAPCLGFSLSTAPPVVVTYVDDDYDGHETC